MDSDSEFYGDEETVSALEERVASFDASSCWDKSGQLAVLIPREEPEKQLVGGRLHNRCEGRPGAWQLNESVDDFLARLPPATTDWQLGLDWLWIANPFIPDDDKNEDHYKFIESGTARLQILSQFMEAGNKSGRSPFVVKKEIFKEREAAIQDLRTLAADCNVLSGKWMLFPEPDTVNEVWRAVAHATARNELGIVAKVDTRASSGKERLICVYTSDFRDKDDVARVLNRLRQLELVRQGGRPIYYKSDAWTEVGIYGGNEWKIPASMYSSNEIFAYIKERAKR